MQLKGASYVQVLNSLQKNQKKVGKALSEATLKHYAWDSWQYLQYLELHGISLTQVTHHQCNYLEYLAERYAHASICRKIHSIRFYYSIYHAEKAFSGNDFTACFSAIKRKKRVEQKQAKVFTLEYFKKTIDGLNDDSLQGLRNKAMLLVGFTTAMRKSELLALQKKHLIGHVKGFLIMIEHSKTNQFGEEERKALLYAENKNHCPVLSLKRLLKYLPDDPESYLFTKLETGHVLGREKLSSRGYDYIIKTVLGKEYSSHSLRGSFVVNARLQGCSFSEIMQQTNHKSIKTVLRYFKVHDKTEHNAAAKLGL